MKRIGASVKNLAAVALIGSGLLLVPTPASATTNGVDCAPGIDASTRYWSVTGGYASSATVTYNGCGNIAVRAFVHCNNFPYGTNYAYGNTVYSVGSVSSTTKTATYGCAGSYMSNGYEENSSGSWVKHFQ